MDDDIFDIIVISTLVIGLIIALTVGIEAMQVHKINKLTGSHFTISDMLFSGSVAVVVIPTTNNTVTIVGCKGKK